MALTFALYRRLKPLRPLLKGKRTKEDNEDEELRRKLPKVYARGSYFHRCAIKCAQNRQTIAQCLLLDKTCPVAGT